MGSHFIRVVCLNVLILLTACSDGDTNSGASSTAAPLVPIQLAPLVPEGLYRGIRTSMFTGPRVDETPSELSFVLTVSGSVPGQQQVRIGFRQWSGTSAIVGATNSFSLSSGPFIVGGDFGRCDANVTYEGAFSETIAAGTASGIYICEEADGPINFDATFRVTLDVSAKTSQNQHFTPSIQRL